MGRNTLTRRTVVLSALLSLGLLAAACGGGGPVAEFTTPTTAGAEPNDLGQAADPAEQNSSAGADLLRSIQGLTQEDRAFRVSSSTGQILRSSGLGVDLVQAVDPSRPSVIAEVAADGDFYVSLDLGPLLAVLVGGNPEVADALDQASMQIWVTDDVLVIDATGYQGIADLNPTADLGPFRPGIGTVDLARLGDIGGEDLVIAWSELESWIRSRSGNGCRRR